MTPRSERMSPVKRLAQDEADAAAKRYGDAKRRLEAEQTKLAQLQGYRDDYRGQRASAGGEGMDAFRLRDYNAFMARIDGAVEQQRQRALEAEAAAERSRKRWMEVLGRARALDKVVSRYQDDERRDKERREQRQSDELAQRRLRGEKE